MTREEQINKIAEDYTEIECGLKLKLEEDWTVDDITTAFIKGAKWADKNPKSHWINVKDDLPCNHKELIVGNIWTKVVIASNGDDEYFDRMTMIEGKWEWQRYPQAKFWLLIHKLPKE